ncbi:MAG: hypothetical protein HC862_01425 [Scytonema sp. RU_4_4]|nr:hypothetical protein [Scytonema sp. RU_4_4]NJR72579.1 hypothetical protein [Scytonema sp. CRU_2_7]
MRYRSREQHFFIYTCILVIILALLVGCDGGGGGGGSRNETTSQQGEPTDTGAVTPATTASQNYKIAQDAYSATLKETLRPGQIAFDIAKQMKVAENEVIEVRVTDNLQRDLKAGLSKDAKTQPIDVTSFLGAELTGASFEIKPLSQKKQILAQGRVVKWLWNVTPTEAGSQKLFLEICAYISIKDKPEVPACLETFSRDVTVAVNPSNWLGQNWKWIVENWSTLAAVLTGASVFIVARWKWIKALFRKKTSKS